MTTLPKILHFVHRFLKKNVSYCTLTLLTFNLSAQSDSKVRLAWKIAPNDSLVYKTIMAEIDSATNTAGLDPTLAFLIDSIKAQKIALKQALSDSMPKNNFFKNKHGGAPLFSKLIGRTEGFIEVNMFFVKSEATKQADAKELASILERDEKSASEKGVQLDSNYRKREAARFTANPQMLSGSIFYEGGIRSFYLPSRDKNILALFFELPQKNLQIGDTWDLDVQIITMNLSQCDSSFKHHSVTLKDLKKQGQDSIAVLEYNFVEFARGEFLGTEQIDTRYTAIAEFSLNKGKWLKYDGIMTVKMKGGFADIFGQNEDMAQFFSLKQN